MTVYKRFMILMAAAGLCGMAQAALDIRIDLSEMGGAPGGNWNSIALGNANSTTGGLKDYGTGANTGVSVTGNGWEGEWYGMSMTEDWFAGSTGDRLYMYSNSSGETSSFTFSNLSADKLYQIEIYSEGDNTITRMWVNSLYASRNAKQGTYTVDVANWSQPIDGSSHKDWLIWDDVSAISGTITINFQSVSGTYVNANNIRILETGVIPEPASALMIGFGGALIALYRRFFGRA